MTNLQKNLNSPITFRVSVEERALLERWAAGSSVSGYIREHLFDESIPKRRTRGKFPIKDHKIISQLLGELRRTKIPNNLNQIARAINCGNVIFSPELRTVILNGCADIADMRRMLMNGLGFGE